MAESESNGERWDGLLTDIEECKEDRRRLELAVERAKAETEDLIGKRAKVFTHSKQ